MPSEAEATKLSDEVIQERLRNFTNWSLSQGELECSFVLPTFPAAIFFVNAVAHLAELGAHHPDITIAYNKVSLRFATHSVGGISEKDFAMAQKVDELWLALNWMPGLPLIG